MDDSGLETVRNSPFQVRRRAQIEAIQAAWSHFFPDEKPLVRDNAIILLRHRYNEASEVYHLLEYVAGNNPKSPLGYALATAKKKAERFGGHSVMAPASQSADVGEALQEPSADYLARAERARRLKADLWGED